MQYSNTVYIENPSIVNQLQKQCQLKLQIYTTGIAQNTGESMVYYDIVLASNREGNWQEMTNGEEKVQNQFSDVCCRKES